MAGTKEGAAKRRRCGQCGQFAHDGKPCGRAGRKPRPLMDRLWEKVDQSAGPDACWPWTASRQPGGYGVIDKQSVTRILMGLEKGDPRVVRHTCDSPPCCNPAHLVIGSVHDNHRDMVERGRSARDEKHWNWKGGRSKNYRLGSNRMKD